jgi:hypothetical protein
VIPVFFTARQLIALDVLHKEQKYNQEHFVQNTLSSVLSEKKRFSHQKTAINFSVRMDNSICHNRHWVVDELCRLKILKTPHPSYSPDISPCDFWVFGKFKGKLKDCHLQGPEEILIVFQELVHYITFEEIQMEFESWRHRLRLIIDHDGEYLRK